MSQQKSGNQNSRNESLELNQELENQLSSLKRELDKRVSETSQFQQMMKMMKSQGIKIKELRNRLAQYESPDETDCSKDDC